MCQPGWEGSLGENGYMHMNSMDREARRATVHGVANSRTQLSDSHSSHMAESLHCSPETTTILLTSYIPIQHKKFEVWKKKKKKWVLAKHFSADAVGVGDNIRTLHTQTVDTESGWNLEIITQKQSKQFEGAQVTSQGACSEMQAAVPRVLRGTRRTNKWWPLCHWY